MFFLVQWVLERLLSIIKYTGIVMPRKEFADYGKGEQVTAEFQGKKFPARIVEMSGMYTILISSVSIVRMKFIQGYRGTMS